MYKILLLLTALGFYHNTHAFVFYEDTKIWNQDSITFFFLDGTIQQQNEVKEFAKLWQRYAGIKFKYTTDKPSFFTFKKYYKITFKGGSNEATRGAINGTIHFGNLSDNVIFRKSTVLHEFGHMLGLGHEHQRADRPTSLNDTNLIDSCIKAQKQSKAWCKENLYNKNVGEVFIESEYDLDSIMHYRMMNITGQGTLVVNKDLNSLSYTDKYFIAMLYNQNIADKTLEKMHQQDLWLQQKFEANANKKREKEIMNLATSSCKPLQYPNKSKDGKYCDAGFMIIDKNGYSFPDEEFKTCFTSLQDIRKKIQEHEYCHLSTTGLYTKRQKWRNNFFQFGNCKRLDTNKKNNQEFYCKKGYSFVTKNNDLIGEKTECYGNEESVYLAMQDNPVCNMNNLDFSLYKRKSAKIQKKKLKTKYCQVVKKKYQQINCPVDFDYTIIDLNIQSEPINNKCFATKNQAINAMNHIGFCQS